MLYWLNYKLGNKILGDVYENKRISCFVEEFVNDYILLNYQWRGEGFCWIDISIKYYEEIFKKWNGNANYLVHPFTNEILDPELSKYVNGAIRELITVYKFCDLPKESNTIITLYMLCHELSHTKRKNRNTLSPFCEILCEGITDMLSLEIFQEMLNSLNKIKEKDIRKALQIAKSAQKNDGKICVSTTDGFYEITSQYHKETKLLSKLISLINKRTGIDEKEIRKILTKAYLTNNVVSINNLFVNAFGDLAFFLFPLLNNDASFEEVKKSISFLKQELKNNPKTA